MSELNYLIEDTGEKVNEKKLREMLIKEEVNDIRNNFEDYMQGYLDLENQFKFILELKTAPIENVIYTLNTNWNIPVRKITELDWAKETEDTELSQEYINGYLKGLEHAVQIISEDIKGE